MKNKLMLRLCLMTIALLSLPSCRQDLLPEKDTYHSTSAFQLTSKRISLNEAKHKVQLLPEIEQVEHKFKTFAKNDAQGKMVNYANGVSIDTESVIYIENGANFHTYTFNIKRANAAETAPLENLLLIPETDGSYKEFLVTYNLTAQEKEKVKNGEPVDTKGKTTITELAKGSFNSGGQLAKMSCNWQEETIWQGCSHIVNGVSMHNQSNVSEWPSCKADTPPSVYTIITGGCTTEELPEVIDYPGGPGSGTGPGGSGSTDPGTPPDDCTSVATDPTQVGLVSPTGCNIGVPTQPNNPDDPDDRTPCQILKDNSANPVIQSKIDSLKGRVSIDSINRDHHETGMSVTLRGTVLKYKVFTKPIDIGIAGAKAVEIEQNRYDIIVMHNHYEDTFPVPQFGDIHAFYAGYVFLAPARKNTYVNYTLNFNGTEYAFRMNDTSALDALFAGLHQGEGSTEEEDNVARGKIFKIFEDNGFEKDKDYTESEALKILMNVLNDSDVGSGNSVHLYRRDKDTKRWAKLKLNSDGTVGQDDCPL